MTEEVLHGLVAQGPLVTVLIVAILFLQKSLSKHSEESAAKLKSASDDFQTERNARLDLMEEHIKQLEARSQTCEADRIRLYQMNAEQEHRISVLATRLAGLIEHPHPLPESF